MERALAKKRKRQDLADASVELLPHPAFLVLKPRGVDFRGSSRVLV